MKIVYSAIKDGVLETLYDNGERCFCRVNGTLPAYDENEDLEIDPVLWESTCEKCGRCCTYRFITSQGIQESGHVCIHYDLQNKKCSVYERRWKLLGGCLPLHPKRVSGAMPENCPVCKLAKESGF